MLSPTRRPPPLLLEGDDAADCGAAEQAAPVQIFSPSSEELLFLAPELFRSLSDKKRRRERHPLSILSPNTTNDPLSPPAAAAAAAARAPSKPADDSLAAELLLPPVDEPSPTSVAGPLLSPAEPSPPVPFGSRALQAAMHAVLRSPWRSPRATPGQRHGQRRNSWQHAWQWVAASPPPPASLSRHCKPHATSQLAAASCPDAASPTTSRGGAARLGVALLLLSLACVTVRACARVSMHRHELSAAQAVPPVSPPIPPAYAPSPTPPTHLSPFP